MNPRISPKALVRAVSIALAAVFLAPALAAQSVQSRTISFEDMTPTVDGEIRYGIYAAAYKEGTVPTDYFIPGPGDGTIVGSDPSKYDTDPPPRLPKTYFFAPLQFVDVFSVGDHHWWSPRGFFAPRPITEEEALLNGASQEAIDGAKDRIKGWQRTAFMGLYETSYMPDKANGFGSYIAPSDHARGDLRLNATLPAHPGGRWILQVVSALGETRVLPMELAAGRHEIIITDVEAGNVPVALKAVDANGDSTYFQEAVALVRKHGATGAPGGDGIATVAMEFAEWISPDRYRIGHLGVGNRSQSDRAGLPVQRGREAMVRTMVYDAYGAPPSPFPIELYKSLITFWVSDSTNGSKPFTSHGSGRHARSGLIFKPEEVEPLYNEHIGLGPKIPESHLQSSRDQSPLFLLEALFKRDGTTLASKQAETQVVKPRTIHIIGHDVTSADGWSYGGNLDLADSMAKMIESVNDIFPYSEIDYRYEGSIPVVGATTSPSLADAWSAMFARFGAQVADPHAAEVTLHLGFTNIADPNWAGMARYTSMVVTAWRNNDYVHPKDLDVIVAHEMGHCFGLSHAPGWGAADVDGNYPYGGGGLTGGWGYIQHYPYLFFAEDDHAPDKLFPKAYWDVMSFGPERVKFSDYNASKLLSAGLAPAAPQPAGQVPAGNEPFKCR